MIKYFCNDCGFKTVNLDVHLIYRKEGKIIETPYINLPNLYVEHSESDLRGYINFYYCENCNKVVKIYTVFDDLNDDDKEENIHEIKEYIKHKRPKYIINMVMESTDGMQIKCPKCNKELKSKIKKCFKGGSTNLFEDYILD